MGTLVKLGQTSLATAMALVLASTIPAFGHAKIVETVPAQDQVAEASVDELRLTFSEAVELAFSKVTIVGADESEVEIEPLSLDPEDPKTVVVPIEGELAGGTYTVNWIVVSSDGHKIEGGYSLEVAP